MHQGSESGFLTAGDDALQQRCIAQIVGHPSARMPSGEIVLLSCIGRLEPGKCKILRDRRTTTGLGRKVRGVVRRNLLIGKALSGSEHGSPTALWTGPTV